MSQAESDATQDRWTYHVLVKDQPHTVEMDANHFVKCVCRVVQLDGTDRSTRTIIWHDGMTGATPKAAIRLAQRLDQPESREDARREHEAKVSIIRKAIDREGLSDVSLRLAGAILTELSGAGYRVVKEENDEGVQLS